MNRRDILLVQDSFAKIKPRMNLFAETFYARFFEEAPHISYLFRGDQLEQERQLGAMLTMIVAGLGRVDALGPALRNLGMRHIRYGVRPEDYLAFGYSLDWTLAKFLEEHYTPEVRAAWLSFYQFLSHSMQDSSDRRASLDESRIARANG